MEHEPYLVSQDESGQHLYDLPQLQADYANRDRVAEMWNDEWRPDAYFRRATARFFATHPVCTLGCKDEYGKWHSLHPQKSTTKEAS